MKDKIIDCGLVILTLLYWFFSGKLAAHFWESLAPWIWMLSAIVAWHSIRAGRSLLRDLSVEPLIRQKSLVVSRYGASFELPQGNLGAYRLKVIATSGGVVTVFLMISCAVWYFAHPRKVVASIPRSEPELAIFMKCDMTGLPVTVPPGGAIRVVPVNEKYIRSNGWGSYEVRNDGMKPMRWPDEKKLQAAKRQHDVGGFCYRCEISNHGRVGVLDVAVPVRFWFGNKGGEQNAVKFTPIVSPLDAGQTSTLFFVNDCPMLATAILPDAVSLRIVGEATGRIVRLNLPHRNPVDPIMMWFPTNVKWVGATACE